MSNRGHHFQPGSKMLDRGKAQTAQLAAKEELSFQMQRVTKRPEYQGCLWSVLGRLKQLSWHSPPSRSADHLSRECRTAPAAGAPTRLAATLRRYCSWETVLASPRGPGWAPPEIPSGQVPLLQLRSLLSSGVATEGNGLCLFQPSQRSLRPLCGHM